jgi:hypothetical protein
VKRSDVVIRIATDEQVGFCRKFLEQGLVPERQSKSWQSGDYFQQLFGLISQVVVGDLLQNPRPKHDGFDGGVDVLSKGLTFDVKTEIRNESFRISEFVHNLAGSQVKFNCDGYIFCSYNKSNGNIEICGWISKIAIMEHSKFYPYGEIRTRTDGTSFVVQDKNGLYEIKSEYLRPFHELL